MSDNFVCVDASLAAKWILQDGLDSKGNREERCDLARQWLAHYQNKNFVVIAPSIIDSKIRHVLAFSKGWSVNSSEFTNAVAVVRSQVTIKDHPKLKQYALEFQRYTDKRGANDALYLATAHLYNCELWTNDDMVKSYPLSFMKQLKDYVPTYSGQKLPQLRSTDEEVIQQLKAIFDIIENVNPHHAEAIENVYACRPGKTDPKLIDMEATTATINFETGVIG